MVKRIYLTDHGGNGRAATFRNLQQRSIGDCHYEASQWIKEAGHL
jgi:hypothetical protein